VTAGWDDIEERELDPAALDRLAEIRVPTLVLVGSLDLDAVHEAARRVADGIAGARLINCQTPPICHRWNVPTTSSPYSVIGWPRPSRHTTEPTAWQKHGVITKRSTDTAPTAKSRLPKRGSMYDTRSRGNASRVAGRLTELRHCSLCVGMHDADRVSLRTGWVAEVSQFARDNEPIRCSEQHEVNRPKGADWFDANIQMDSRTRLARTPECEGIGALA
jgi:hypothetical protein